jgi:hypothetical protein
MEPMLEFLGQFFCVFTAELRHSYGRFFWLVFADSL